MQPTLTQVPPMVLRSTSAAFAPRLVARMAAANAALPEPIMMRSKSPATVVLLDPVRADTPAAGQVLAVLSGEVRGQPEKPSHPRVEDPIDHGAAAPVGFGDPAPLEAGEVVGYPALRRPDQLDQLGDRPLPLEQGLDDPQPGGVSEHAEVPGQGLRVTGDALNGCSCDRTCRFHIYQDSLL